MRETLSARAGTVALLAAAGLALGGCLTVPEYARISPETGVAYGYFDIANPDGGHTIRVILPAYMGDPQLAYAYWDRRATELCGGPPARKVIHTALRPTIHYDRYGGMPGDFHLEGFAWCTAPAAAATPP